MRTQIAPPERLGGYEYWTERTASDPKPVLLRRRLPDGQPTMLLNANEDAAFDDGDLGMVREHPPNAKILWANRRLCCRSTQAAEASARPCILQDRAARTCMLSGLVHCFSRAQDAAAAAAAAAASCSAATRAPHV